MNSKIKSKILEKVEIDQDEYEIAYIDIEDFTYIKSIDARICHPEVEGLGHYVSNSLWFDEEGNLLHSVIPHNEIKSSGVGTTKKVEDMTNEEFADCQKIINDFYPLIDNGLFKEDAKKVFQEFLNKINEINKKRTLS